MMMAIPPAFAELHMKELQEVVIPKVSTQWIQIAPLMNFDPSEIQNIKEKCGDDSNKCCAELFEIWLQKEPGRQWEDLLPILEKADSMIYDQVTAHLLGYPRRLSSLSTYTDSMLRSKYLGQPTMIGGLPTIASAMLQSQYTGPSSVTKMMEEELSKKDEGLISHEELKSDVDKILIVETDDSTIQNTIQILLVTANETEYGAALTFLDPMEGSTTLLKYHHVNSRINKSAIYIFGKFGYFNAAVHLMTQQGPAAPQDVVTVAADCFGNNLNAIFAVGVACGVEGKSKMLDVLVSKKISSYTAARIGTNSDSGYKIENRSTSNMPLSSFLQTYFDQPPKWPGEKSIAAKLLNKPTQVSGNILSGNYLIDNTKFKQKLLKAFAYNAIGIEMEGAGLFQDYPDTQYKIMVIKAVCDFGDGKKDKTYQPTAAMLAVECLKHCIGSSPYLPQKLTEFCGNKVPDKTPDIVKGMESNDPSLTLKEISMSSEAKGFDIWIQYVSNKYYPATDPEWKHGKEIDGLLKDFPVIIYSIVPDSKRKKSGEHSEVKIHFPYFDYDVFEVSKCDKNITKLLCIKKKNSTQFEKIFSKILFSEKFKHLDNLEAYLKKEKSSDFYLLFIRPVESKVIDVLPAVLTPSLEIRKFMAKDACEDIMDRWLKTDTAEIHKSVTCDVKEKPANKIKFRKMCHVSNKLDLPDSNHPDWNEIEVAEARYEQYHGNLLLGLPVAGFTIAPLGKSIYPFLRATTGKKYYRVQVPFDHTQYHIFNMNDDRSPADQKHLLCIRKNDDEKMLWLLRDRLLPDDEFRSYFIEGYKEDPCNKKNRAAINVYFIENVPIKGENWDTVEKEHYDFGLIQLNIPYCTNEQLLDAWIRRQSKRVVQEFIQCFIQALVTVTQEHGLM